MSWKKARWTRGKRTIAGEWDYYRPSDIFTISLNKTNPFTNQPETIQVKGETPEWGGWKLLEEAE